MTPEQLATIQHALGVDKYGQGVQFRNHYCGDPDLCRPIVQLGYMQEHPASEITGGDPLFTVTNAGKEAMRAESPHPPKLTRSQKRYREFLAADSGLRFGEWMKLTREVEQ